MLRCRSLRLPYGKRIESAGRQWRKTGSIMIDTGKPEVLFVLFMLASCRLEHLLNFIDRPADDVVVVYVAGVR